MKWAKWFGAILQFCGGLPRPGKFEKLVEVIELGTHIKFIEAHISKTWFVNWFVKFWCQKFKKDSTFVYSLCDVDDDAISATRPDLGDIHGLPSVMISALEYRSRALSEEVQIL